MLRIGDWSAATRCENERTCEEKILANIGILVDGLLQTGLASLGKLMSAAKI